MEVGDYKGSEVIMAVKIAVEEDGSESAVETPGWRVGWRLRFRFTPASPRSHEAHEGSEQGVL